MFTRKAVRTLIVVVAATALVGSGLAVRADEATWSDPKDMDWGLDIATVSRGHAEWDVGRRLVHTISTHERWRSRSLDPRCATGFGIRIRDNDRSIQIYYNRGRLRSRVENRRGELVGRVRVQRPDRRSVRVWVRPRLLGDIGDSYEWFAASSTADCSCKDNAACPAVSDRAPNRGTIRHRRH